jgi:hypothetical protein
MRRASRIIGLVLGILAIAAGGAAAGAIYTASTVEGKQGPPGPRGPAGPEGPRGERGPQGNDGEDGEDATNVSTGSYEDYEDASEPTGEKHYFYGGRDLGTVSQHEAFCRQMRDRLSELDGSLAEDQSELQSEGCRGGGLIKYPD